MGNWSAELGRERSKLGRFLDKNGITQGKLQRWSGVGINTLTRVCSDVEYKPSALTKRTIVAALQRNGYGVEEYDFW